MFIRDDFAGSAFERSHAVHTVVLTVDLSRCSHVLTVALVRCSYRCINTDSGEVFIRLNQVLTPILVRCSYVSTPAVCAYSGNSAIFVLTG